MKKTETAPDIWTQTDSRSDVLNKIIFFVMAVMPFFSFSKGIDDLIAKDPEACQGIPLDESYMAMMQCADRIARRSDEKLSVRLTEIRKQLQVINYEEYTAAFEVSEKKWAEYKHSFCEYQTLGIEKDGRVYDFHLNICNILENYRHLDALKGEPSIG